MEIVKPNNHNFNYIGDASRGVADLPCRVGEDAELGRTITSAWKPSEDEMLMLMNGGTVELMIVGHGQPPVMLSVAPAQPDLFVEQPLHGVVGYVQRWHDESGNWPDTYTFDGAADDAVGRLVVGGWKKIGEPFPVAKAIGYKAADRALAELQAAVRRAGFDILHTDSEDGFPLTIAARGQV